MEKILLRVNTLLRTGFFHIFGSSVINKIITFLSSIVLVRILSKTEYGIFTYAWNIYSIILILNGMGIESGALQISSEHSGDIVFANKVSNYGTRFGIKFDIGLFVLILGIGLFAPLKIEGTNRVLCSLCMLPMAQLLFGMTSTYLRSQKRNQDYAKFVVFNTCMIFAVSVGCAYLFREIGMIIGYYIAYICSYFVGLIAFRAKLFSKEKIDLKEDKKPLLKVSFITMLNNGLSQLMYLLDVFVLGIVDPQETILASYKVATMIPTALTFIPLAMITYLYPYFAEHQNDGNWCLKRYKQVLLGLGGLNLILSLALFFGAKIIIRLMFGVDYLDAIPVFRVLAINYFFSGTFRIISGNILVTQRKLNVNLIIAIISSAVNIVADYFFIQWWGAIGAAIATALVVLISSVISTVYLIYTLKNKPTTRISEAKHENCNRRRSKTTVH